MRLNVDIYDHRLILYKSKYSILKAILEYDPNLNKECNKVFA